MISIDDFGEYYFNNKDYTKAEKFFIKSLGLKKHILGQKHIEYAYSLHNLGSLYGEKGHYEEAEALLLEALLIRSDILGKKNKLYLYSLENLALKQSHYFLN
jgi:tetratricopeptide (TPR) repeat protein